MPLMDLAIMARTARLSLAGGLKALQGPGVPQALMSVAEPIAEAMGLLHRIEASGGADAGDAAPSALVAARRALAELQRHDVRHPSVDEALESVAGSLGVIHQLAQAAPPPTRPSNHMLRAAPEPQPQVAVVTGPAPAPAWQQPAPQPMPPYAPPAHHPPPWPASTSASQPQWHQTAQSSAPTWQQPQPAPQPQQAWPVQAAQPDHYPPPSAPATTRGYQQPVAPAGVAPAGNDPRGVLRFEAALGTHSATNFYKGLSGNDVIDSGGLFVATYQVPEIGRNVQLKVLLPGGYEFEALGVVRWTRDAPESGGDAAPGFGVQFTHISPEGRQLVYRYVRNREPLFHDDG